MKNLRKYLVSDSKGASPSHEQSFQQKVTWQLSECRHRYHCGPFPTENYCLSHNSTTEHSPLVIVKHLLSGDFYFCQQVKHWLTFWQGRLNSTAVCISRRHWIIHPIISIRLTASCLPLTPLTLSLLNLRRLIYTGKYIITSFNASIYLWKDTFFLKQAIQQKLS